MLLEQVNLLDAPIHIVAGVIPRVTGVMLFNIRPAVGQISALYDQQLVLSRHEVICVHFSRVGSDIGKCIVYMGQLFDGEVLWVVVAAVDGLFGWLVWLFINNRSKGR